MPASPDFSAWIWVPFWAFFLLAGTNWSVIFVCRRDQASGIRVPGCESWRPSEKLCDLGQVLIYLSSISHKQGWPLGQAPMVVARAQTICIYGHSLAHSEHYMRASQSWDYFQNTVTQITGPLSSWLLSPGFISSEAHTGPEVITLCALAKSLFPIKSSFWASGSTWIFGGHYPMDSSKSLGLGVPDQKITQELQTLQNYLLLV